MTIQGILVQTQRRGCGLCVSVQNMSWGGLQRRYAVCGRLKCRCAVLCCVSPHTSFHPYRHPLPSPPHPSSTCSFLHSPSHLSSSSPPVPPLSPPLPPPLSLLKIELSLGSVDDPQIRDRAHKAVELMLLSKWRSDSVTRGRSEHL